MWTQLRKLYEAYVAGRNLPINDNTLRGLIVSILGDISEVEMSFLLNGLYTLASKNIEFVPFALIFIYLVAELGLSRFQKNHSNTKKSINFDEFLLLFKNSFNFLGIGRIKKFILSLIFQKIDKNHDGLITFDEYLEWVKKYLAVGVNRGEEYYTREDDAAIGSDGDLFEPEPPKNPESPKKVTTKVNFNFSDWNLAKAVRQRMW